MKLTVFHDGQYWVGVAEASEGSKVKACRFIFGSEPQDGEVLDFVLHRMMSLLESTKRWAEGAKLPGARVNPKRLARMVARETRAKGVSTYAQEAMRLELEARKREKAVIGRREREELERAKRERKIRLAKEKRRGH